MKRILGSAIPGRRELLAQLGLSPDDIRHADIDESPAPGELPRPYSGRMAREKAEALDIGPGEVLLTSDTTVAVGRRILGKPEDAKEARAFLELLSGRRHRVITAVAVRNSERMWERDVVTTVRMKPLSGAEIDAYLATDDWQGKAGAYAMQGFASAWVKQIHGSYSNVVGLPLREVNQMLTEIKLNWL